MSNKLVAEETIGTLVVSIERYRFIAEALTERIDDNYPVTVGDMTQHVAVSNFPIIAVNWTIDTVNVVAGFVATTTQGQAIPVGAAMLAQNPLTFAYTAPTQSIITVEIVTTAGTANVSNSFTVTSPTVSQFRTVTGNAAIVTDTEGTWLKLTNPPGPGIDIYATVVGDQATGGTLGFIQLANNNRAVIYANSLSAHLSTNGQLILDVGMTGTVLYQDVTAQLATGQSTSIYVTDSPAQQLQVPPSSIAEIIIGSLVPEESYQTFLMFCPNSAQAVWVPLEVVNWGWGGVAAAENGSWILTDPSVTFDPEGVAVNQYPSWTTNTAAPATWLPGP